LKEKKGRKRKEREKPPEKGRQEKKEAYSAHQTGIVAILLKRIGQKLKFPREMILEMHQMTI
jgi:hypothetical protein